MGRLLLADLYFCRSRILEDGNAIKKLIEDMFVDFNEQDGKMAIIPSEIEGWMGLFRLKGNRLTFQTVPSLEYFTYEIYGTGKTDLYFYSEYLVDKIIPQVVTVREFSRGEHIQFQEPSGL